MLSAYRVILSMIGILMLLLTLGYTAAQTVSAGNADAGDSNSKRLKCSDLPSRYSIRSEYAQEKDMGLTHTEDGTTGADGGLIYVFSMYRNCSR